MQACSNVSSNHLSGCTLHANLPDFFVLALCIELCKPLDRNIRAAVQLSEMIYGIYLLDTYVTCSGGCCFQYQKSGRSVRVYITGWWGPPLSLQQRTLLHVYFQSANPRHDTKSDNFHRRELLNKLVRPLGSFPLCRKPCNRVLIYHDEGCFGILIRYP